MSNHIISLSDFADYDMSLLLAASGEKELSAVVEFSDGGEAKTYFLVTPGCARFDNLGAAIDAYNAISDGGSR